ncbi:MAG: hypothetical protein JSR71_11635 [Proteobacteria bacterium]|nr:hypothetical protein [Pseudomonadota bacterium]
MREIVDIGDGAIFMLLSVLDDIKGRGIQVFGSLPVNSGARSVLERSGFLNYVVTVAENKKSTKNSILTTGTASTNQLILKPQIRNAMNTVRGSSGRNPLVYGCVFEMMRNSVDHAFKTESQIKRHWGVSHKDSTNTVKFSFVDNGKGLITTFKQGLLRKMFHLFMDRTG